MARLPGCIFILAALALEAVAAPGQDRILRGYASAVAGPTIAYASCQPDARSALLIRSLEAKDSIAWQTEPVPPLPPGSSARFVWLFGLSANMESREFTLWINGERSCTFRRPNPSTTREWTAAGDGGVTLRFRCERIDKAEDLFGYAFLTVPASRLRPGEPLTLKVTGESAGSRVWYMTFQHQLADTVIVTPQDALLKGSPRLLQPVMVEVIQFGPEGTIDLRCGGSVVRDDVRFGYNSYTLRLPEVERNERSAVEVRINGGAARTVPFTRGPVRHWTVNLVQHAHTDIGYTRPQADILAEHLRFIDYVLDYCDQTDSLPPDARFRWTCEASWPVREYLSQRPVRQVERLKKRIREGRVEVTGMMFNMSEIADEQSYVAFLRPVAELKAAGLPVVTAMQDDVNGAAWCLVDYFHDIGIRYLTMGQNDARALKPFLIPTAFWWESAAGNRVLVFRADHYMTGNFIGLEQGRIDVVEKEMSAYLRNLTEKGYPFDRIAVQYSGYFTDNSAPSTVACGIIRDWNNKYAWPHLRTATDREFPEWLEKTHSSDLSAYRGAWPDWWTDGFGSGARETAVARAAHADVTVSQGLFAMARGFGADVTARALSDAASVQDALLFYDEHTFGAAESISDPLAYNSMAQWSQKAAYAWDAVKNGRLLREHAMGLLQGYLPVADVPTIAVFNSLGWSRSGLHTVYIDNQLLPPSKEFRIVGPDGKHVPVQKISSRADGTYWGLWLTDVPAMGYGTYRIEASREPALAPPGTSGVPGVLENSFYRLTVDTLRGGITGLFDKALALELLDARGEWIGGQFIHETLGNREQLEQLTLKSYERTPLKGLRVKDWSDGEIWSSVSLAGGTPGCDGPEGVTCEIRLFKTAKRVELHYSARKLGVTSPEAFYVAFPFDLPNGRVVFEAQGGAVTPGVDQIPGSASDWNTVQTYAAARITGGQIVISSEEAPLMMFGGINLGMFRRQAKVDRPAMYSWVLNNYWTTNFLASQEGEIRWSYSLTSSSDTTNLAATKFGWNTRFPMVSRVIPAGKKTASPGWASLFPVETGSAALVAASPSADGSVLMQFREVNGNQTAISFPERFGRRKVKFVRLSDVLGGDHGLAKSPLALKPHQVVFVKMILE
jgi:alpha-mannosidase